VPFPEVRLLTKGEVFKADGKVDAELIKQHMLREGRLAHDLALAIIEKVRERSSVSDYRVSYLFACTCSFLCLTVFRTQASEIMKNEPNVLNLKPPIAGSLSLSLSLSSLSRSCLCPCTH
jgi:hypothetical protein